MADSEEDKVFNTLDRHINIEKKVKVISVKRKTLTKTTKQINHEIIKYKDKQYVVCCVPFNEEYKMFVIDFDKKDSVINKAWHYMQDGSYISHTHNHEDVAKQLYLHNFVMDKLTFNGKGQQHTIDHINRIGTDNRKCNLREVTSQTAQNFNQKQRERTTELPDDCGIELSQIPKNIYYGKPSGLHGDFFYIELISINALCIDGKKYNWKSTKSKSVSLKLKLQQTIDKLIELKNLHQELEPIINDSSTDIERNILINEYNDILRLSNYPKHVIESNIKELFIISNINITESTQELTDIKLVKNAGKKTNNLPVDCGITMEQIPRYCYFKPETDKRGCKFVIDRHPKLLENDIRTWSTTESKKISINEKFNLLLNKLKEFD